ncbi:penicillin-binding transpeptidase domain-containing protein [secondary endosymbiont of Ctenarytaina eucalypti]|uniref:Cell division protein FtsI/penicillin-binding protein 2 n=1 Tax=secondary endosymbiont of Ctenarytaina eucalypti TaxID=1199245 RepID=J3VRZ8_9ENTR|nr:penicillin-binding transpeptidase domain-containing protein [secondary endosymbiont of Ctenarytaina eucalypti]AFP84756.1 cell division protein FtsI/penicillin-binding protein 2 [secondary endosymbiont of Ctenarytaina eucalypti]
MPLEKASWCININFQKYAVYFSHRVNPAIGDYMNQLYLIGIDLCQELWIYYSHVKVTAHLLSVSNIDRQSIYGAQKSFARRAKIYSGALPMRKNRLSRVTKALAFVDSQDDLHTLALSIDKRSQSFVYCEPYNAAACNAAEVETVISINVNTDAELYIVNNLSYNPYILKGGTMEAIQNRAITDIYELVNLLIKVIAVMEAMRFFIVRKNSVFKTPPYIIISHQIKDLVGSAVLKMSSILQQSNNISFSKLRLAMPSLPLIKIYASFGLVKAMLLDLIRDCINLYCHKKRYPDIEKVLLSYDHGLIIMQSELGRAHTTIRNMNALPVLLSTWIDLPVAGEWVLTEVPARPVVPPGSHASHAESNKYCIAKNSGIAKTIRPAGHGINKYIIYTVRIGLFSNLCLALVLVINIPQGSTGCRVTVFATTFSTIMGVMRHSIYISLDTRSNKSHTKSVIIVHNQQEASGDLL